MTTPTTTTATVVTVSGDGYTIIAIRDRADGNADQVVITNPASEDFRWTEPQLDLELMLAERWLTALKVAKGMLRGGWAMTALWILVIVAAFAVASSLAFLAIYGAIVISGRNSRQEERETTIDALKAEIRAAKAGANGVRVEENGQPAEPSALT